MAANVNNDDILLFSLYNIHTFSLYGLLCIAQHTVIPEAVMIVPCLDSLSCVQL